MTLRLIIILATIATVRSTILTSDRVVPWTGNVGIPGGIPNRTTVSATLNSIDNTGSADVTAAINNAIQACPSNQVVVLPSGFFKVSTLQMKEGVVLRGQGMTNTVIRHFATDGILFGGSASFELDRSITAGFTKGSTSITLSDATSYSVGMMGVVDEDNDAAIGVNLAGDEGPLVGSPPGTPHPSERLYNRAAGHHVEVTAKAGNVLTISPPLAYNFSAGKNPKFHVQVISGTQTHMRMAGIENLTLTNTPFSFSAGNDGRSIVMLRTAYCWLKNVEVEKSHRRAVLLRYAFRNQIEGCTIANAITIQSDMGYGFTTDFWSTANLVQNNIANKMLSLVAMEGGTCYNVYAYNFYTNGLYRFNPVTDPLWMPGGFSGHAGHYGFNLFEGNIGDQSAMDFIHGSGQSPTWLRNHFRGQRTDTSDNERCIQLHAWVRNGNVVGNVLGNSQWTTTDRYESAPGVPQVANESGTPAIYWLGWRSVNNVNTATADFNVRSSIIRHGNWDAVTRSVNFETSISDHVIPSSYFYTAKPSFWGVNFPWPSIGSDLNPQIGTTPAHRRWLGIDEGSSPGTPTTRTILVRSDNPVSGVLIEATTDNNGNGDAQTPYDRVYDNGASVLLNAPASFNSVPFTKWQRDGVDFSVSSFITISADNNYTFTAVYGSGTPPPVTFVTLKNATFLP